MPKSMTQKRTETQARRLINFTSYDTRLKRLVKDGSEDEILIDSLTRKRAIAAKDAGVDLNGGKIKVVDKKHEVFLHLN